MFDAIILMAGKGTRANLGYNKVFYKLNNQPLYFYSLNEFKKIKECNKIILVVNKEDLDKVSFLETDKIKIVLGGNARQDSVFNGVNEAESPTVLIHDGARANLKVKDIINLYNATKEFKVAVLANKVNDTIKVVNDGFASKTLDRSKLWAMQTPQGLNRRLFLDCLNKAKADSYYGFDDVELIEKYSDEKVKIVEGSNLNIKATREEDLHLLELLLKE